MKNFSHAIAFALAVQGLKWSYALASRFKKGSLKRHMDKHRARLQILSILHPA
jgi:hypothetical protein